MARRKILITGPGGRVGTYLVPLLRGKYSLRLLDQTKPEKTGQEEFVQADIRDYPAVSAACQGIDALVHMAAISDEADFGSRLLPYNLEGVHNVFEAARESGVDKVIFFSTGQTVLYNGRGTWITPAMPARPWTAYACTKLFGEALARYYADHHGMSMIVIRLGWFQNYDSADLLAGRGNPREWCSPKDLEQLVTKAIDTELRFGTYFGVSNNTGRYWDISNAQVELGYDPVDDAATFKDLTRPSS